MKSVSAAFKTAWARRSGKRAYVRVSYKRRYWNGAAMVYEANWHALTRRDMRPSGVGDLQVNLDTDFESVYNATQITLLLNNAANQWLEGTTSGSVFGADGGSANGYKQKRTQFRIEFGYRLADGTIEYTTIFTGVLVDILPTSDTAVVSVLVQDNSLLLQNRKANTVSDAVTGHGCTSSGDNANKNFTTNDTGVYTISKVYVDGVLVADNLWKPGGLDQLAAASITLTNAPTAGQVVTYDAILWKKNQKIEDVVGLLCDAGGITAGSRTILPVLFPGAGLAGSKTIDTQTDWEAGTLFQNVSTKALPGSITRKWYLVDDFADGDYTAGPVWTHVAGGSMSVQTTPNRLQLVGTSLYEAGGYTAMTGKAVGTWEWKLRSGTTQGRVKFFMVTNSASAYSFNGAGYALDFNPGGSQVILYRLDPGTNFSGGAALATWTSGSVRTFRVTRTAAGVFSVYADGTLLGTASDSTYTTSDYFGVQAFSGSFEIDISDIYYSPEVDGAGAVSLSTAIWRSAEFDLLGVPTAFGTLDHTDVLHGGTIAYAVATHATGGSAYVSGDFVALGTGNQVLTTPRQYVMVQAELDIAAGALTSPEVQMLVLNFSIATVTLSIARHGIKSCWDMIQRYAQLCGYETGFDAGGNFFFRPKAVSPSPVMNWTRGNVIGKISRWETGYQKVVNTGIVSYAGKTVTYDCTSAGEAHPNSLDIHDVRDNGGGENWDDLLLDNDVNIAAARAQTAHDQKHLPKRRATVDGKYVPWLDPADVVSVTDLDDPKKAQNYAGDPLQTPGAAGPDPQVLFFQTPVKILGIAARPDAHSAQYIVEEVLS